MDANRLPVVLIISLKRDGALAEQFAGQLAFLQEAMIANIELWMIPAAYASTNSFTDFEQRLTQTQVVMFLGTSSLLRGGPLIDIILTALAGQRDKLLVLPVVLSHLEEEQMRRLEQIGEQVLPSNRQAVFGERDEEDVDAAFGEIVDVLINYLIAQVYHTPYRTVNNRHVFISYSRRNYKRANAIRARLAQKGYSTWMDKYSIRGGQNWVSRIDKAIRDAWVLLLLWSPRAKSSDYVNYEWAFAMGNGTCVCPIIIERATLHQRLAWINCLNWHSCPTSKYPWQELWDALKDAEQSFQQGACNS